VTAWTYGKDGAAHPIRPGQIWAVGPHLFACGDLTGAAYPPTLAALIARHTPALVYADPPYNAAAARGYRTKAGLPGGPVDYPGLIRHVLAPAATAGIPAYLEASLRNAPAVTAIMAELGGTDITVHQITYDGKHPAALTACTFGSPRRPVTLDGLDDEATPAAVLAAYRPGCVLDPVAGRGLTSRAAARHGWVSLNHDLHPARLSAAMTALAAQTRERPAPLTER
jgi:hypothetical protein